MQCVDAAERLLAADAEDPSDADLDRHVAECAACAHVAGGLRRLDAVLASALMIVPPLDLQRQLTQIALDAARSPAVPWWTRLMLLNPAEWLKQPQTVAVQGLAAIVFALASWQVFGWISAYQPVVGDVGYAVELVAGSPATAFLSSIPIDLQSLTLWSLVGIGGWLISENGLIGRRLADRQRLP